MITILTLLEEVCGYCPYHGYAYHTVHTLTCPYIKLYSKGKNHLLL